VAGRVRFFADQEAPGPPPDGEHPGEASLNIEKADVIVTSPDRNFVTLRLETDDGLVGLGDGTLNGRELAVVSYLRDHVVPLLIGRDASRIEETWQFLYRGAYWRRGPVTMAAIAAVDVALWDIKGKAAECRFTSCSAAPAGQACWLTVMPAAPTFLS
jgi:L-alanine-DL-glutamate epimerase-like enolase superfamily enzyme